MSKLAACMILSIASSAGLNAGDWTAPVEVLHELRKCVTYRAALDGEYLVIEATLEGDWHTFTMDNKRRAAEKLAGKPSLGIDQPTEIKVSGGLEVVGPWHQLEPKDFSKPEIRWYSWGYEKQAIFAAKVRRAGTAPGEIGIRGQACTETSCKNIDVTLSLPVDAAGKGAPKTDLSKLIPVR